MRQNYHQFVKSYQCRGSVYLSNRRHFDCDFLCGQTEEGDIIVRLHEINLAFLPSIINYDSVEFVSGYSSDGQYIRANITLSGPAKLSSDSNGGFSGSVEFYARELIVGNALSTPLVALKFYVVNFEFVSQLKWRLGVYDVAVKRHDKYQEAEEEMRATKRPKMTAELTITSPTAYIANEYEAERVVHDLCALLSLAKGCQIQWLYWDAYTSDEVRIKTYHWNGIISQYGSLQIIVKMPPEDINNFVQQTFEPYRKVNERAIWKFNKAIAHYASTVSREGFLELRAIDLVVLVDYLTQHYAASENTTHFIQPSSLDAKRSVVQKLIGCALESHFSAKDLVKNELSTAKKGAMRVIVSDMTNMIDCLNRRSFPSSLRRLLKHLNLKIDEAEVKMFVAIRNKLIHDSNFLKQDDFPEGTLYESPWRQFLRILSLTSRIMLGILQYRGYYYDWGRFEKAEWAGAETGRVRMPYVGSNEQPL